MLPVMKCIKYITDVWGMTSVHWAAAGGHLPVLQFLIDSGAKVNTQDNSGKLI